MLGPGGPPEVQERPTNVGVLHAQRTVEIPGKRDAALAAARLVGRQTAFEAGVIEPLHLPGHDAVLHVDLPRASARAVDAVRAADDLVVLPAVPVELLPTPQARVGFILDPR